MSMKKNAFLSLFSVDTVPKSHSYILLYTFQSQHKPNFEHTQPPITIHQQPQWSDPSKIVSMDPFGHLTSQYYKAEIDKGLDIRPSIAITRAHMIVPELQAEVNNGGLKVDGKVMVNEAGELNVHKAAVDPVWYLPGVAARLNVEEDLLRRALL